ncbi:hypothetical protein E6C27_scaffold131G002250 [Cucumis melo var. makuwa]|uniref:Ty3-gypsy retrotransposon protein n=1 Tax=Cucumis melo var. makuwa TaxID=1194695 RepID=A0A5A7ULC8_CUCMM|nr:hypothetical protein E6C27_scaffold131G002250 [Cucumis melo var. makuwa]
MNGQPPMVLQIGHPTVPKPAIPDDPSLHLVHPSRPSTPHPQTLTGRLRPVVTDASSSSATFKPVRIRELTLKFSGPTVDSLGVDSIKGHNQVTGKGFLTTGPRIEAGNVVIHRGLYVDNCSVTASCSSCAIVCNEMFTDRHRCPDVLCIVVMLMGYVVNWNCMSMDFKVLMLDGLVWTERLIGVSFGITRLIRVSFRITRLICASFGITRLMCKGTARGRPTRGKKDA